MGETASRRASSTCSQQAADLLKASSLTVLQQIGSSIADELAEAAGAGGKKKAVTE